MSWQPLRCVASTGRMLWRLGENESRPRVIREVAGVQGLLHFVDTGILTVGMSYTICDDQECTRTYLNTKELNQQAL